MIRKEFYGKSKKEAEEKRDEYLNGIKNGLNVDFKSVILGELMHSWLFEVLRVSNKIKPSTFERYEGIFRNYIKNSEIYGIKLNEVKSIQLQRYYNKLCETGKSINVIQNLNGLLKYFFNYAIDEGYILKNPCSGKKIVIPGSVQNKNTENEITIFNNEEISTLRKILEGHRLKCLISLALGTGLRQGELLALKWNDIDFSNKELRVERSIKSVNIITADGTREYKTMIQSPKTTSSIRTVPIPSNLINMLKEYKPLQEEENQKTNEAYNNKEFVFTTKFGDIIDSRNLTRSYERLLKKQTYLIENFML